MTLFWPGITQFSGEVTKQSRTSFPKVKLAKARQHAKMLAALDAEQNYCEQRIEAAAPPKQACQSASANLLCSSSQISPFFSEWQVTDINIHLANLKYEISAVLMTFAAFL